MVADHVLHRLWDRGGQASEKLHGFEDDVSLPGVEGLAELESNLSVWQQREALLGKGGAEPVAQQALQLGSFALVAVEIGVEREAVAEGAARLVRPLVFFQGDGVQGRPACLELCGGHDACFVVRVRLLVLFHGDPHAPFDAQQQRLDVLVGRWREPVELQPLVVVGVEDAVGQPAVCVGCQLQHTAPELEHGHCARHRVGDAVEAGAAALVGEHGPQEELQHPAEQVRVADDEQADVVGQRQGPLAVGRQRRASPCAASRRW